MKKTMLITGLVLGLAAGSARAARAKAAPAEGIRGGSVGVGATLIPTRSGDLGGITGDYWLSDKIAIEALLGFGSSSYAGGSDSAGKPINDSGSSMGIGAGARFNLINTADVVYFGLMGRLAYTSTNSTHTALGTASSSTNGTVGLFVGADVEAFVPMWRSISVEASTGLNMLFGSVSSTAPGSTSIAESSVFLGGTNALPLNVAFHYYF